MIPSLSCSAAPDELRAAIRSASCCAAVHAMTKKNPAFLTCKKTGHHRVTTSLRLFLAEKTSASAWSALLRCKGRSLRSLAVSTWRAVTVRCAARKPCSSAFHPSLSASGTRRSWRNALRDFSVRSPADYSLRHCFSKYILILLICKKG